MLFNTIFFFGVYNLQNIWFKVRIWKFENIYVWNAIHIIFVEKLDKKMCGRTKL